MRQQTTPQPTTCSNQNDCYNGQYNVPQRLVECNQGILICIDVICIFIPRYVTFDVCDWSKSMDITPIFCTAGKNNPYSLFLRVAKRSKPRMRKLDRL